MAKFGILSSVAIAALVGALTVAPMASNASVPSSPAEKAATAELNRNISEANAASEARAKAQEAEYQEQVRQQAIQYEEQKRQWELQQQQYMAQLKANDANR